MSNYWSNVLQNRIGRRRALIATGTTAAAAAFLAACGGSSDSASKDDGGDKSGLVTKLTDTTKQAKRGGTKKYYIGADVNQGFDVHVGSSAMEAVQVPSMGALLIDKPGFMKGKDFSQEGDVMESWEFSPDKLTLTMKLRPNNKFAPIGPVNGRAVDMQDVLFSWDRFLSE